MLKSGDRLKIIGDNIVKLRKKKGITSQELGYICNIDKSQLGKIEKGKINITIETLVTIANGLGADLQDLIN